MEVISALLSFLTAVIMAILLSVSGFIATVVNDVQVATLPPEEITLEAELPPATTAPPTKPKAETPKTKPVASTPIPEVAVPPPSPTALIDPEWLNTQARAALVNILCTTKTSGAVRPISGSGVLIDSRGVIITNAHVAQLFLLKDYPTANNVDCVIRTGNPATPKYHATLLYLPPTWVKDNAEQIIAQQAKGTGENDYALLLITSAVGSNILPSSFPYLPITSAEPTLGESTLLAAYSAGFLDGITIQQNLYILSAYAVVKQLFTFGEYDVDLFSIGGTVVSQGGSSGGASVRASDGKLVGIIVTSTAGDTTAQRDLRAITLAHINRSLITHGKGGIDGFLQKDLMAETANFAATTAPGEKELLIKAIESR